MAEPSDDLLPTRATLIKRLQDLQDHLSWQEFFDTYWKLIYNIALKRGLTEAEAQDVVQETMISVSKHMPTFRYDPAIGSFKAWLLNMTRWRISDQFRRRAPYDSDQPSPDTITEGTSTVEKMADMAGSGQEMDKLWDDEWKRNLLDAATLKVKRRLDPEKYQIFDFCVNKEWPPEKVAGAFGISVDQVYLAKHRVTQMIKKEVQRLEKEMT
jgi:RNA polymerase sigma factor (sigma-70 family)